MEIFFVAVKMKTWDVTAADMQRYLWMEFELDRNEFLTIAQVKAAIERVRSIHQHKRPEDLSSPTGEWYRNFGNPSYTYRKSKYDALKRARETARKRTRAFEESELDDEQYKTAIIAKNYTALSQRDINEMIKTEHKSQLKDPVPWVHVPNFAHFDQKPTWMWSYAEKHFPELHEYVEGLTKSEFTTEWIPKLNWLARETECADGDVSTKLRNPPLTRNGPRTDWTA
ncbi:MAG: hypothetical protein Q9203_002915 [Teloschistes exilis]